MKNEKAIEALNNLIGTLVVVACEEERNMLNEGVYPIATIRIVQHILEMWEVGTLSVGLSIDNARSLLMCVSMFDKVAPYTRTMIDKINSIIED